MTDQLVEFSMYLRVTDRAALIKAGRKRAIKDGLATDMKDARQIIAADDVSTALRMILDPGISPDGTEILDSACEVN